jgi:hypothetical protein
MHCFSIYGKEMTLDDYEAVDFVDMGSDFTINIDI